jgi:hypothetical protein
MYNYFLNPKNFLGRKLILFCFLVVFLDFKQNLSLILLMFGEKYHRSLFAFSAKKHYFYNEV